MQTIAQNSLSSISPKFVALWPWMLIGPCWVQSQGRATTEPGPPLLCLQLGQPVGNMLTILTKKLQKLERWGSPAVQGLQSFWPEHTHSPVFWGQWKQSCARNQSVSEWLTDWITGEGAWYVTASKNVRFIIFSGAPTSQGPLMLSNGWRTVCPNLKHAHNWI